MSKERLLVYWDNKQRIGKVWLEPDRKFMFQYDESWLRSSEAFPISLRLPLQEAIFDNDRAKIFFSNLLPEGEIREFIAKKLNVSSNNEFSLLERLGGECAGALSLWPETSLVGNLKGELVPLSSTELENRIDNMQFQPLVLSSNDDIRLSLAGAQEKLPVHVKDGELYLPKVFPSTHIVKAPILRLLNTVENEAYCMKLAQKLELHVSNIAVWQGTKQRALLVERYDRKNKEGDWIRLHQEDFCQALGVFPEMKYESEGGPSLSDCFNLIENHSSQPALDKERLLRWTLYNFIIGNHDGHAKNLSFLFLDKRIILAPLYDLISTEVYPHLSKKLAMKIGGQNNPRYLLKSHWEKEAPLLNIKLSFILSEAISLSGRVVQLLPEYGKQFREEYGTSKTIEEIEALIRQRCNYIKDVWKRSI